MKQVFCCAIAGAASIAAMMPPVAPAVAQSHLDRCLGTYEAYVERPYIRSSELVISSCMVVIRSGQYTGEVLASAFYNRGIAYADIGENDRAIQDYDQVIRLNPNHAKALNKRGVSYQRKGLSDRAIQDYDHAIQLDPNEGDFFNNRCKARAIVGQLQLALTDCNQSSQLRPMDDDMFENRGFTYFKLGDFDNAIADYDWALRLWPKKANSLYGRGLAKLKKRDNIGGNTDIARAKAIRTDIVEEFAKLLGGRP